MLKVTVELISAIDGHREELVQAIIYNDGTGNPISGNYIALLGNYKETVDPVSRDGTWKEVVVLKHNRRRDANSVWSLLYKSLKAVYTN